MEPSKIFRQRQNDARNIEAIADEYKTKIKHDLWLVDGLQKDAIQNSWDARMDKKHATGWECGFSLMRIGNQEILCISDSGTTGLNGTEFSTEDEMTEILNRNDEGEDLAYFLNSNWSAKKSEEGGSRGRGKTLFLRSSQDRKIYFDSFRSSDKTYLFGELYLDKDKQVKFTPYYGIEGEEKIKIITEGELTPLTQPGTRVFITNPDASIKQSITNGTILSFISYSSWERIKKYQAKVFIQFYGEKKYAILPYWYENEVKDVLNEKEYGPEIIKEKTQYKTKRLVLRYAPNADIPETIKGIAIQRNGMTIERILADELVPHEEGMSNIYGWLEMECKPLEEEMKLDCEGPEHFNFNWTIRPAKYLRDYIRLKIKDFAKEFKIMSSEQAERNKVQKLAEEKALKSLAPLFKKIGLFGHHKGYKNRNKSKRKKDEPLRLSTKDIEFPREPRRINYDEKINNVYVIPINDLEKDILVRVHMFMVSKKDGRSIEIAEREIFLHPGIGEKIGTDSIIVSKNVFEKGEYSIRANMRSLQDTNLRLPDGTLIEKGTKLYERVNLKFYVETDPPEHGPFDFHPKAGENKDYLFDWDSDEDGGYIIYYNSNHPKIKPLIKPHSGEVDPLSNFLTEQGALLAFQIRLTELIADRENETDKEFQEVIKSKDLTAIWPIFLKKYSEFLWDLNS